MLHDFLTVNRTELFKRCRTKAASRNGPARNPAASEHGVPVFLEQLIDVLRAEQSTPVPGEAVQESSPAPSEIRRSAAKHGAVLLRLGFTVDQVVHSYGDVCQSVTELALDENAAITVDEFRILNRCLDDAIADAVTSFGRERQTLIEDRAETLHGRLGRFAEEHQKLVDVAMHAFSAIKTGNVGLTGATGALLSHTLTELRGLTARALPEIRLASATTTITTY